MYARLTHMPVFSLDFSLRRVHWISLVDVERNKDLQTPVLMCGCALSVMLLTLAVVFPTPHDYSGAFQGRYSARFIASKRVLSEQEGFCTLQNHPQKNTSTHTHTYVHVLESQLNSRCRDGTGSVYVHTYMCVLCVTGVCRVRLSCRAPRRA